MSNSTSIVKSDWQETIFQKDESLWLKDYRDKHYQLFQETGLPTKKNEYWKYTDLSVLVNKRYDYVHCNKEKKESNASLISSIVDQQDFLNENAALLVLIDGCFNEEYSNLSDVLDGMRVCSLKEAMDEQNELVKKYWPKTYCPEKFPFACINAALFNDGVFIHVFENCRIKKPIHILSITTCQNNDAIHPRNLIILEKDTTLTVFEEFISLPRTNCESFLINHATSITLEDRAKLTYIKLQKNNSDVLHFDHTTVTQKKETHFHAMSFLLAGKFFRVDLVADLSESLTRCDAEGFYRAASGVDLVDNHIAINHLSPHTESTMLYKGIIEDKARAIFNGRVYVSCEAQKITAYQANHNLLLSDEAEVYSKPELEIYSNDVKCKHGSTVGQLDEGALFYLRSRGIPALEAEKILMQGFANEITQRIPDDNIRHYVEKLV